MVIDEAGAKTSKPPGLYRGSLRIAAFLALFIFAAFMLAGCASGNGDGAELGSGYEAEAKSGTGYKEEPGEGKAAGRGEIAAEPETGPVEGDAAGRGEIAAEPETGPVEGNAAGRGEITAEHKTEPVAGTGSASWRGEAEEKGSGDRRAAKARAESAETAIDEDGAYISKDEVALYLHVYGKLPSNYITKSEAAELGWKQKEGKAGQLDAVAPGKSIGGDRFGNYEGQLPEKKGRKYFECDINYHGGDRGAERIIYSNDGLVYYTGDHYKTFELLYTAEGDGNGQG